MSRRINRIAEISYPNQSKLCGITEISETRFANSLFGRSKLRSIEPKNKMNRKGLIRIAEAIIAIMIILTALLLISAKREVRTERDLTEIIPPLLDEVAKNSGFRTDISQMYHLGENLNPQQIDENERIQNQIEIFIRLRIHNPNLDFVVKVCAAEALCFLENFPRESRGDVFSYERVIRTDFEKDNFEPRKIKLFLWRKG